MRDDSTDFYADCECSCAMHYRPALEAKSAEVKALRAERDEALEALRAQERHERGENAYSDTARRLREAILARYPTPSKERP